MNKEIIYFKDKQFCTFYKECWHKDTCSRPLTPEVKIMADIWWGGSEAPIDTFMEKPDCFMEDT